MTTSLTTNPASASYATSGFSGRMGWGPRPALLLIDVCTAYFTPSSPLSILSNPSGAHSPVVMRSLLAAAREGGVPVLWTQVRYEEMREAGLFYAKAKSLDVWRAGDERGLAAWVEGLEPREGEAVVAKRYPSAFFGTCLGTDLRLLGVDTLVICGLSTSGCIRATVLDAMCHGFRPMVVGTACGDRTQEIHDANIFDMNAKNGDVVSEDEAIARLKAGWGKES